jgi:hypothetical protein
MRQRRWLNLIKNYELEVHYHPGKANVVAIVLCCKAHFIPVNTCYKVQKYAEIYIACVLCIHGVPKMIISDRGS